MAFSYQRLEATSKPPRRWLVTTVCVILILGLAGFLIWYYLQPSVSVQIAFANGTTPLIVDMPTPHGVSFMAIGQNDGDKVTPGVYGAKTIAAYLAEDIDHTTQNNKGNTQMIYLNPECDDDIRDCDVHGANGASHIVTTYFEYARPTDLVNADLNSQKRLIQTGTYRYVRLEFCKYLPSSGQSGGNYQFMAGNMTTPYEFWYSQCGVTSAEMSPPLVLERGDAVRIVLAYELEDTVTVNFGGSRSGVSCAPAGYCFQPPTFRPSVVRL